MVLLCLGDYEKLGEKLFLLNQKMKFLDLSVLRNYFNIVQCSIGHGIYKKDTNILIVDSIQNFLNIHK